MTTIYVKQNDTKPDVLATALDYNDDAIPLNGATIKFFMNRLDGTNKVDGTASIVVAEDGTMNYVWQTGDLDTVGKYNAEFQITFPDTTILTAPSKGYITIIVVTELN